MAFWVNFRGFGGKHVSFFGELWEDVGEDDFFWTQLDDFGGLGL